MRWIAPLLLIAGCDVETIGGDKATDTESALSGPMDRTYVISWAGFEPASEGIDLDGDGDIDNAMGEFGELLNGVIEHRIQYEADNVGIFRFWTDSDPATELHVGYLTGFDTDADALDNFTGEESFEVSSGIGADGYPEMAGVTRLDGNRFSVELPAGIFSIANVDFPVGTTVKMEGTLTDEGASAKLYFASHKDDIGSVLGAFPNADRFDGLFDNLADVDMDGDGEEDSISLAMRLDSVPCLTE